MSQEFCGTQLELVKQKGMYSYEDTNGFEKTDDSKLPKKEDFFSSLQDELVSDKDYNHAKKSLELI